MRFKRNLRFESGWGGISFIPYISVLFLLLIFVMAAPALQVNAGLSVRLPHAVTAEGVMGEQIVLILSGEHIVYFENRPQSPDQVEKLLSLASLKKCSLLVKADAACPLEYTVSLLDAARKAGIQKVALATN